MNKLTTLLISLLVIGLIGCSSSDDDDSSASSSSDSTSADASGTATGDTGDDTGGTTTSDTGDDTGGTTVSDTEDDTGGTTAADTTGDASGATAGTDDATAGGSTDAMTGGGGMQDVNPGSVPNPILAEPTALNVSDADSARGYKIFAGNEVTGILASIPNAAEFSYFNLTFPCTGDAVFENFPAPQLASIAQPVTGNFVPGFVDATEIEGNWQLDATTILTGDPDNGITTNDITVSSIVNGDLIVDVAAIESLLVTRIVQFEQCN